MKKTIIFLSIISFIFLTGCADKKTEETSPEKQASEQENQKPAIKTPDDNDVFLSEKLCENQNNNTLLGFTNGEIFACGEYYKVAPPTGVVDAPSIMYSKEGKLIGFCGGKPKTVEYKEGPECQLECQSLGIKLCEEK